MDSSNNFITNGKRTWNTPHAYLLRGAESNSGTTPWYNEYSKTTPATSETYTQGDASGYVPS